MLPLKLLVPGFGGGTLRSRLESHHVSLVPGCPCPGSSFEPLNCELVDLLGVAHGQPRSRHLCKYDIGLLFQDDLAVVLLLFDSGGLCRMQNPTTYGTALFFENAFLAVCWHRCGCETDSRLRPLEE